MSLRAWVWMLLVLAAIPLACRSAPKAQPTAASTRSSTPAPFEGLAYVEVETVDATGAAAANLPGLMQRHVERELEEARGPFPTGAVGTAPANAVAYRVVTVLQKSNILAGYQLMTVECSLVVQVLELPAAKLQAFSKQSAAVQAPPSQTTEAIEDCVAAVIDDTLKKNVVPYLREHASTRPRP
jgi:hypothetical protein